MKRRNMLGIAIVAGFMLAATAQVANGLGTGGVITYTDSNGLNPTNTPYANGYVVHTFTNSGTFNSIFGANVDVLVVAGGGGGGSNGGGGGGAGGVLYSNNYPVVSGSNYTVTVGAGGPVHPNDASNPTTGSNSVFGALTALGGGGGSSRDNGGQGATGGSGGGGGGADGGTRYLKGSGTVGQGNDGGNGAGTGGANNTGGGGGGAGSPGTAGVLQQAGNGGTGVYYAAFESVGGSPAGWFAGGGAGGKVVNGNNGLGGNGGGGNANVAGVANTGGGGGGGGSGGAGPGIGGSGIVIVRYPYDPGTLLVALTTPANSQQFLPGSSVTATVVVASGTIPYTVTFYTNSVSAWSTNNASTNLFTIDLGTLANGAYEIYASVTDSAGTPATATSVTNTFTVAADTTVPTPDPMAFAVNPWALNANTVVMTAATAIDTFSLPVEYCFTNTVNGNTSGWILSTVWTNTGLTEVTSYGYRVKARDAATPPNETDWSPEAVFMTPGWATTSLYWDGGTADLAGNGNGASQGGDGTWNTAIQNWDLGSAYPHVAWYNPNNDMAVFGGTGGTVTLGTVAAGSVTFTNGAYTLTGGSLALSSNLTVGATSGNVTLSTPVSGSGGMVKNGNGNLTVNANNTYSGGTVLNAGQLTMNTLMNGALGTGPITLNGGLLFAIRINTANPLISNGGTIHSAGGWGCTFSGPVTLNSNLTVKVASYDRLTFTGNISGAGSLIVESANLALPEWYNGVFLAGNNTYSGGTHLINKGLLTCSVSTALCSGPLSIDTGSKLQLNFTGTTRVESLTLGGVAKKAPGTYGSVASGADYPDDTYFMGNGTVSVPPPHGTLFILR